MFGKAVSLFNISGFKVKVDASWLLIAFLVAWSLATGFFPVEQRGLSARAYWFMGVAGALGLFISIVIHEFTHSLVARRYGMPIEGITLFIFGGVAEMSEAPANPRAEFFMAVVGPVASILLGALFFGLAVLSIALAAPAPVRGVLRYFAYLNGLLAVFNLLPAFPLDGGRVFRSILWGITGNLRAATRVATSVGSFFGVLMMAYGFWKMMSGDLVGGMWLILIGIFLQSAAQISYKQLMIRKALEGEPVRRFMNPNPATASPGMSIEDFVEASVYRYQSKMLPVVDSDLLMGCISFEQIKQIPREEWRLRLVSEVMRPCSPEIIVTPQTDAVQVLSKANRNGMSEFLVVDGGRLVGMVSLKDLLKFLSLKMELEEDRPRGMATQSR